jgi:hypothetical protein
MASRTGHEDGKSGLELIKFLNRKKLKIPTIILTGIEKYQKEAIKRGAAFSFDLELLIGFLGPERQTQREEVVEVIKNLLKT